MAQILIFILLSLVAQEIKTQETCLVKHVVDDFKQLLDEVNNQTTQSDRQQVFRERYEIFIKKLEECPKLKYKPGTLNAKKLWDVVWGAFMVKGQPLQSCLGSIISYTLSILFQSVKHILYQGLYSIAHIMLFGMRLNFHIEGFENRFNASAMNSCLDITNGVGSILQSNDNNNSKINLPNIKMPVRYTLTNHQMQITPYTRKMYNLPQEEIDQTRSNPDDVADNIARMLQVMDKNVPVHNNPAALSDLTPNVNLKYLNQPMASSIRSGAFAAPTFELGSRVNELPPLDSNGMFPYANPTIDSIPPADLKNLLKMYPSLNVKNLDTNSVLDDEIVMKLKSLAAASSTENPEDTQTHVPIMQLPWWGLFWRLFG